jgi:hypothetical protein
MLLHRWQFSWLLDGRSPVLAALILGFGALCLAGWLVRLARLRLDGLYVLFYLLVLYAWPLPREALRYAYPILPVLLAQGLLLLARLPPLAARRVSAAPQTLAAAVLLILVAPSLALMLGRRLAPVPAEMGAARNMWEWYVVRPDLGAPRAFAQVSVLRHLRAVGPGLPEQACLFAIKPTVVMLYTGRASYPPPPVDAPEASFAAGMQRCDYVYAMAKSPSYPVTFYPLGRLGERARHLSQAVIGQEGEQKPVGILARIVRGAAAE